jgi:hypothetical protein
MSPNALVNAQTSQNFEMLKLMSEKGDINKIIEQAKQMEKQQIVDAYDDGNYAYGMGIKEPEQYYNETFNIE